jgi:hypothetical protein
MWHLAYPMGTFAAKTLGCKTAAMGYTDFPPGKDSTVAFKTSFEQAGAKVIDAIPMGNPAREAISNPHGKASLRGGRSIMKRTRTQATSPKTRSTSVSTFTKEEEADFMAFTMRGELDDVADYTDRGRKFGPLSDEDLCARFVEVFRKFADNPADWDSRAIKSDLEAEFQLRNREIPFDLIREDFERLKDKLLEHLDRMKNEDPDRWIEMNLEISRDFEQFLNERKNAS